MQNIAIKTENLTKKFGKTTVVNSLNLEVPSGSIFGFLGPNGAGKTTTIRMLLGLVYPTSGQISILGKNMPSQRKQILPLLGALIEGPSYYPFLSGWDNLARLYSMGANDKKQKAAQIDRALFQVGLSDAANKKVRAYSLGMRQRLGLAVALLKPSQLLILDEPTNGLDPQGTIEVRSLIRDIAAKGTTVILSSHLLFEIEQICSHAAVLKEGNLVAQGEIGLLTNTGLELQSEVSDVVKASQVLKHITGNEVEIDKSFVKVRLDGNITIEQCCKALVEADIGVRSLGTKTKTLEEVFVELTGASGDV